MHTPHRRLEYKSAIVIVMLPMSVFEQGCCSICRMPSRGEDPTQRWSRFWQGVLHA